MKIHVRNNESRTHVCVVLHASFDEIFIEAAALMNIFHPRRCLLFLNLLLIQSTYLCKLRAVKPSGTVIIHVTNVRTQEMKI